MHSNQTARVPAVLILTADKAIGALSETLWAAGMDSATVNSWVDAHKALDGGHIAMAVVDGDLPASELARLLEELPHAELASVLWLVSADSSRQEHLQLPKSGAPWARVSKPIWPEELLQRVKAVMHAEVLPDRRSATRAFSGSGSAGSAERSQPGQVITVFSNKGGVGKSTIALNLAVGLQRLYRSRVLLVDADLYYGDLEPLLDARGRFTIADLCMRQTKEADSLLGLTTEHASGISFLPRPPEMARIETLDMSYLVRALPVYTTLFDHVVINMSTALDEFNLSLLEAAHRILVITTPEMAAALNTARFMEVAAKLKLATKTSIVLNRSDGGAYADTIQERLSLQFAAKLPSAGRVVVKAGNEGTSLFVLDPGMRQDITRALASLAEHVAGRPPVARRGWDILGRIVKRAA